MKLALTIAGREFGLSLGQKTSPDVSSWLRGDDSSESNSGAKLQHPYEQSTWVFIATNTIARSVSQIPFRVCKVDATAAKHLQKEKGTRRGLRSYRAFRKKVLLDNVVDSGDVVDLFKQPHPSIDRTLYWQLIMTWRCLRGEFFIAPLDGNDQPVDLAQKRPRIERLLPLNADMFWHIVVGFTLEGWRYTGSPLLSPLPSQIFLPSEVIYNRTPNPHGFYWRGMSPLSVAMVTAGADYAAEQFMKGLMMNNADTGVIVTTDQQLSPEQAEQIKAALRERKRKAGTPDRPLLLVGGAKIEKPTVSSADMQFIENRKINRETILAIYNVPMSMTGITERTQSLGGGPGQEQERLTFMESSIAPHCRDLEAAHDRVVKSFDPQYECYFDIDDLPIMQQARMGRLDSATKAFAMGIPLNDINELYDLGFEELPWGDTGYLPFNLQPAGADPSETTPANPNDPNQPAEPGSQEPAPSDPNQQNDFIGRAGRFLANLSPDCRRRSRKAGETLTSPHVCKGSAEYEAYLRAREKRSVSKVQRFVFEQRRRVLKKLPEVMKQFELLSDCIDLECKVRRELWQWKQPTSSLQRGVDDLWNAPDELERLMKAMTPLWISDLEDGGKAVFGEIGSDPSTYKVPPTKAIEYMAQRRNIMSGVNDTTWAEVRSSLQQGLADGDTMDELAQRVRDKFQGIADGRAYTVALTETTAATNSGRHIAMVEAKVPRKGWGTSGLENTRTTHLANAALSEEQNGIPIDETWPNGCQFPGDPEGDPGETINCRCYGYAILDK